RGASASSPEARAAVARDLEAALAQHPSASNAAQAALELGNLRYEERDYVRARSAWEVAVARAASPTVRTLARAGVGDTWEAEGHPGKAAEAYQAALALLRPADFYYEELLLALGRAQELSGNRDAAVETYRRLVRERPRSPRTDDVRARLAALGAAP
ncbi:MAG: tetratricopeptide repeat protein, partial [Candidatus Rokuibacteriota bacterium]